MSNIKFNIMQMDGDGVVPIESASITAGELATGSVDTAEILDGAVATADLADGAVTSAKIANTTGAAGLGTPIKSAVVVYDFAVDGGVAGTIALAGSPTIPDNAVVWVDSYDVLTTCTSAGADAGTIALQLPTDGVLTTAVAISDGSNPWDAGVYSRIAGGLATPLTKKTTAARVPSLLVAEQALTAGKIVFHLSYWVSQ